MSLIDANELLTLKRIRWNVLDARFFFHKQRAMGWGLGDCLADLAYGFSQPETHRERARSKGYRVSQPHVAVQLIADLMRFVANCLPRIQTPMP